MNGWFNGRMHRLSQLAFKIVTRFDTSNRDKEAMESTMALSLGFLSISRVASMTGRAVEVGLLELEGSSGASATAKAAENFLIVIVMLLFWTRLWEDWVAALFNPWLIKNNINKKLNIHSI
jgi:hypothetical protein